MKVGVKRLDVEMELKNKGLEIEVRDKENEHLGDLIANKKGLTWCNGKTTAKYGITKKWSEIINFFNS